MKKFIYTFLLTSFYFLSQAQSFESPVKYNDYIVGEQHKLMNKVIEYIVQSVHSNDFGTIENKRLQVIGQIESAITKMEKLEPYKEDSEMRDEALAVLRLYREAYKEDFSEINLLKKDRESSYEAMEKYFDAQDKAEEKMNATAERFRKAQKKFAEKYELTLEESKKDNTMEIISDVNKYVRDVFLEYFKISKLSGACLDALNKQDIDLLEKNRQDLLKGANEAYSSLRAVKPYAGDEDFKNKGLAYVTYFKVFAKKDLAEIVSILKNEARTNEDIDKYNTIIDQYNKDQQTLINNFNEAQTKLMRTHIPKTIGGGSSEGGEGIKKG